MTKKSSIWISIFLGLVLILSACGEKSQEDVVDELQKNMEELSGYKTNAQMKMNTGQEEQSFDIEVWHKKEDFYRVTLSNDESDKESQIILKNEDGVFVLTPELNKSFKFQSEWPENSSQPYLYQSLVSDIISDDEVEFEATENEYIFHAKTNYQSNNNLPFQEIYIDKKSYTPVLVKILDKDKNALVEVSFSNFELNPTFEETDFEIDAIMETAAASEDVPVSGDVSDETFAVVVPNNTVGAELTDRIEEDIEDGKRVISTYTGEKNFTLVQEKRNTVPTLSSPQEVNGDIVNLGHAVGALSENAVEWDYQGMNFYLASDQLTREELIEVAQSVVGTEVK
ncbi:outer membrane lipoprotein carrier protein LolA [Ornithinibacillus sp. L9]|uniref:Outer membrane lipoprotein carrier protein LolA n=1 Tax=Ornithinibacillus caprae TaxID=2678566 RepID=A0A6N8FQ88_9BACI|nr:outer membrane lipoprotein carrier protein LolA [Ornithinibacillus caprae]MUK89718.1 outer membrane lipoprotein carrier protein LolA [Ornithinibacillus caprae]